MISLFIIPLIIFFAKILIKSNVFKLYDKNYYMILNWLFLRFGMMLEGGLARLFKVIV